MSWNSSTTSGKTKVAILITSLAPGGAEKCVTQLLTHIDPALFEVQVFVLLSAPVAGQQIYVEQLQQAKIPIHFLNAAGYSSIWRVWWELRKALRQFQPHIVQSFLVHANILAILLGKWMGMRNIFISVRVNEPRTWLRSLERWCYPAAHRIVYVSKSLQEAYEGKAVTKDSLVIANAVNPVPYSTARQETQARETPYLLLLGRLHKQKGVDWLLPHLPQFLETLPHAIWLAGEGQERLRYEDWVNRHQLQHRIQFLGWRSDVPQLLAQADLLLFPSQYEGMSHAVLEAMATGTPVITRNIEGMQELLGDAATDCIVSENDPQRFLQQAQALLDDAELRYQIGQYLQERAAAHFAIDSMTTAYEQLWQTAKQ